MYRLYFPKEKVLGALWGLLIGDATGVSYEFNSPENIPDIDSVSLKTTLGISRQKIYQI